jgi:hypothetical protein
MNRQITGIGRQIPLRHARVDQLARQKRASNYLILHWR